MIKKHDAEINLMGIIECENCNSKDIKLVERKAIIFGFGMFLMLMSVSFSVFFLITIIGAILSPICLCGAGVGIIIAISSMFIKNVLICDCCKNSKKISWKETNNLKCELKNKLKTNKGFKVLINNN